MYVASDTPDPAEACMPCLCLEVCAALWCSLSSRPGYLLHFSPTGTHSPVGRLASLSSGVNAVFISGALAPIFEFLPQPATKQPADFSKKI